jgi:hypothetical protein
VLLATTASAAAVFAMVVAILILGLASVFVAAPKAGRTIVAVLCVLGGLGVIAGGIIGAAEGSRDFERHEAEHEPAPPDRRQPELETAPAEATTPEGAN